MVVVSSGAEESSGARLSLLERNNPERESAVLIPELVERRWYYFSLHNQRAAALKGTLYLKGSNRIAVVNVPWYVQEGAKGK